MEMASIDSIYHVLTQSFFHLTLAHKLHIDTSNVAKIYLATLFVEKMALTQINVVSNDTIGL